MDSSRHRVIHSLSLSLLQQEVTMLLRQGWTPVGSPALAQPIDRTCPAYWVQALHLSVRKPPGIDAGFESAPKSHPA